MNINFSGKYIIKGRIQAKTGISIGGATTGLEIGGVDTPVIKDAKGKPYIPGSSIKGKMRSLLEKSEGLAVDGKRVQITKDVSIHLCEDADCKVCNIFGRITGKKNKVTGGEINIPTEAVTPTRLIVRDAMLDEESLPKEVRENLELEWTEIKWENVIDRVTSQATPRQIERVPGGTEFEFEAIYNVYNEKDRENLKLVFKSMELLEDDYIGGQGSRGYGKINFKEINVYWNSKDNYENGDIDLTKKEPINKGWTTPSQIIRNFEVMIGKKNARHL